MAEYPRCPDRGGPVVPRSVLPDAKAPPNTEHHCFACLAAFRREGTQLVKIPKED